MNDSKSTAINVPELSVVILCYRSEKRVLDFAKKAKEITASVCDHFEIVLVGNYFPDANDTTPEFIHLLANEDPHFKAVTLEKEGMMGWDLRKGLEAATGKNLCFIDGDGQFPLESIATSYNAMKTGKYDLVKSYRDTREDGWTRKMISWIYNIVFKILFPGVNGRDMNSKPKTFTREAYEKLDLKYDDWFIDAEIMIKASKYKFRVYEFPIQFLELEGRKSLVNYKAVIEFVRNLIAYRIKGDRS